MHPTSEGNDHHLVLLRSAFPLPPLTLSHAEGSWIYDADGRKYFDASSGSICVNVGHANETVLAALRHQAGKAAFVTPGNWLSEGSDELAEKLVAFTGRTDSMVMFSTTGTAANELAIHVARQYQRARAEQSRSLILTSWLGFHGCSELTLALSGHRRRRPNLLDWHGVSPSFDPPFRGYHTHGGADGECWADCADEVARVIDRLGAENVAGLMIEPINGASGGGLVPPPGYLARIREVCHKRGVLVLHDEVMVGLGRTGSPMAADLFPGSRPDISVVSKGLGAGYATISAVLCHGDVAAWFRAEDRVLPLASTMAGAPLSTAVGLSVLEVLEGLDIRSGAECFAGAVRVALDDLACVKDVRGAGYFWGVELGPGTLVQALRAARNAGIVLYPFGSTRPDGSASGFFVAPPLTSTSDELEVMLSTLRDALTPLAGSAPESR